MVNLVLTPQQVRAAPREVRDWLLGLLAEEMAFEPQGGTAMKAAGGGPSLAECTLDEARLVLEDIAGDYLSTQVFFELGRRAAGFGQGGLHRVSVADIMRHTQLSDPDHLAASLERIASAFRKVRSNGGAILFALDRAGGIYVSDITSRSVRALWQALVADYRPAESELPGTIAAAGPNGAAPLGAILADDGIGE